MNIRTFLLATSGVSLLVLALGTRADDWLNQKSDINTAVNYLFMYS
jgi:hypothetical protein